MSNYSTTFRTYILRTAEFALNRVGATANLLPTDVRQQALHALSYALGLADIWPVARDLLLALAPKLEQAGHREDWMPYLVQGIAAGEGQGDWPTVAEFQLQLGMLYRMLSEFAQAKTWLTASQLNFAKGWDADNQARVLNELAWLEHLQHHYEDATTYTQQALRLLPPDHPERGMSYRVLGMIAIEQKHWLEAEELHRKALNLFNRQGERRRIAWGLQNLAYALRGQNKFEGAFEYYQRAAKVLYEIQDLYNWVTTQINLGLAYLYAGQPELATPCLLEAEAIAYQLKDTLQMARIRTNQGLVYLALYDYKKAENAFLSSVELYTKLEDERWRLNAIDGLAIAYLAQDQFVQACEVLEAALQALPHIKTMPNYGYLLKSLNEHLQQARKGQGISIK